MESDKSAISIASYAIKCGLAGGFAGLICDTFFYPLDTFKTYIQASEVSVNSLERVRKGRLYSGFSCALAIAVPYNAVFFLVYEYAGAFILKKYKDNGMVQANKEMVFLGCAALAEFAGTTLCNPIEVVRQNMQLLTYPKPREAIKDIWLRRGVNGFYTGYVPTLLRTVPFSVIQLPLYEYFQRVFSAKGQKWDSAKVLLSGGLSCLIAGVATHPFDVIKTRMMANVAGEYELTAMQWVKRTVTNEGIRGLLKGLHYRVLGASIGGMFYYWCYATAFKLLGAHESYQTIRQ